MRLAFAILRYYKYLGGSRDFLRIARACQRRGHEVVFYATIWEGDKPEGIEVHCLKKSGRQSANARALHLAEHIKRIALSEQIDGVIGEIKIPGLDVYYASVTCYAEECLNKPLWHFWLPNYRRRVALEKSVFSPQSDTTILCISEREARTYQRHYDTQDHRLKMLPPTMDPKQKPPAGIDRYELRRKLEIAPEMRALLFVGTDYIRKGLNRAIEALASLDADIRQQTHLFVVGHEKEKNLRDLESMAQRLQVSGNISFLGPRDDVPELMAASDMLVHPALIENTGGVILEGIVAGLPVLTTETCGYEELVRKADAGMVVSSPFKQAEMNAALQHMLTSGELERWRQNGLEYGKDPGLYQFPEKAAEAIEEAIEQKRRQRTQSFPERM